MLRFIDLEDESPQPQPIPLPLAGKLGTEEAELAGLRPLPINRMHRQAGRQINRLGANRQLDRQLYGGKKGDRPTTQEVRDSVINKNRQNSEVIDNWDPLDAEWKERSNRLNPNKRSKPAVPDRDTVYKTWQSYLEKARSQKIDDTYKPGKRQNEDDMHSLPLWDYLQIDGKKFATMKQMVFEHLDNVLTKKSSKNRSVHNVAKWDVPVPDDKIQNHLLAEWKSLRSQEIGAAVFDALELVKPIDTPSNPNPQGALPGGI